LLTRCRQILLAAYACAVALGCSQTGVPADSTDGGVIPVLAEACDGLDNDRDGLVDEDFKGDDGTYLDDRHCGACNVACVADEVTEESHCEVTDNGPACRATACVEGYVPADSSNCVSRTAHLCSECLDDGECGGFEGALCVELEGELRCTVACDPFTPCPESYFCSAVGHCVPPSRSCRCGPGDDFFLACSIDVDGADCLGKAICDDGVLSECTGDDEVCDGLDNDCDGETDDPFVGPGGFLSVDIRNCGACGVDCTLNPLPERDITCGGPATSPLCALECADSLDGIQPGDLLDADLDLENGCECEVKSLSDDHGTDTPGGDGIDTNCDGADGVVSGSFYVVPDGDDNNPGSHLFPMGSVSAAVEAASATLGSDFERPDVLVAAGAYEEVLVVHEGVNVLGGYRTDFLERDPARFVTEIRAPSWDAAPGGAALIANDVGYTAETRIDGVRIKGASAPGDGRLNAFGAYLEGCGGLLTISDSIVHAGDGADGEAGGDGAAGLSPDDSSNAGKKPRVAEENGGHTCIKGADNTVRGGRSESVSCGSANVSGGNGGDSVCPGNTFTNQADGNGGSGPAGTPGGGGGSGGWNANGPIFGDTYGGCGKTVCCDLADFLVDGDYETAGDGQPGRSGSEGNGGQRCDDPVGALADSSWQASRGTAGTSGKPGSGGGGGGAGGGAAMDWVEDDCPFTDGIGGGGGSGGAGGCGGSGGSPGTSGGPSVGIVVAVLPAPGNPADAPVIRQVIIRVGDGGDGGHGGHGGDGGQGDRGASGGSLEPEEQIIPPLAGATTGGHGGAGGSGGGGGGGGGGCGGTSAGIWIINASAAPPTTTETYKNVNTFANGSPGQGGEGGGGGESGADGREGEVHRVIER